MGYLSLGRFFGKYDEKNWSIDSIFTFQISAADFFVGFHAQKKRKALLLFL